MNIPPGKTEAEVKAAIEKVVDSLASAFVFGCYGLDDVRQQAWVYALEVLASGKYDPARPLENFLYCHVRNQLINLRRNKLYRNDPPCPACHSGKPCGPWGEHCVGYARWRAANRAKSGLMRPDSLEGAVGASAAAKTDLIRGVEAREAVERAREALPPELQGPFLRMLDGLSVGKVKRERILGIVRKVLGDDWGRAANVDE